MMNSLLGFTIQHYSITYRKDGCSIKHRCIDSHNICSTFWLPVQHTCCACVYVSASQQVPRVSVYIANLISADSVYSEQYCRLPLLCTLHTNWLGVYSLCAHIHKGHPQWMTSYCVLTCVCDHSSLYMSKYMYTVLLMHTSNWLTTLLSLSGDVAGLPSSSSTIQWSICSVTWPQISCLCW